MKKIISFLSLVVAVTAISCNDSAKEVKKEVIVLPAPAPAPAPVIIVKDPPAKDPSITVDKNGVKIETKKVKVDL